MVNDRAGTPSELGAPSSRDHTSKCAILGPPRHLYDGLGVLVWCARLFRWHNVHGIELCERLRVCLVQLLADTRYLDSPSCWRELRRRPLLSSVAPLCDDETRYCRNA